MKSDNNYLSEFEQEWNSDQETAVHEDEYELDNELEISTEDELETDDEFEIEDEFEADDEFEIDNELELDDNENNVNLKFTDRLYSVLNGNHESELEFEQELNEVLHEMEKDYFWGRIKSGFNKFKKSGLFSTLKKIANKTPIGNVVKQYTALARGDIKGLLKGLAGQALTTMVPGGAAAKQLLNLEIPVSNANPRKNAQVINKVAKQSYANLIRQLGPINSPSQLNKVRLMGKSSFNRAWQQINAGPSRTRRITLNKGDTLIIKVI